MGDYLYGTPEEELPGRFALHSEYLSFIHPVTGERLTFESPLPPELRRLLGE
jgi:23S rRNA pseudouridine1911/1915/1917 synthase